jgi:hypothetical protein
MTLLLLSSSSVPCIVRQASNARRVSTYPVVFVTHAEEQYNNATRLEGCGTRTRLNGTRGEGEVVLLMCVVRMASVSERAASLFPSHTNDERNTFLQWVLWRRQALGPNLLQDATHQWVISEGGNEEYT